MSDTPKTRLLLVDDDDDLRQTLCIILELGGFFVRSAANVNDALKLIASDTFEVLVSDLHMPHEGDGLTVVSAMRHANPEAITIIFTAYPEMKKAAAAILAQADDIFVKPAAISTLVDLIRARLKTGTVVPRPIESVATILEEETDGTIRDWLLRVYGDPKLLAVRMDNKQRSAHLPQLFGDWSFACETRSPWAATLSYRLPPPSMAY